MAYTYLIGWTKIDKWYYGSRGKKGCDPSEFWERYFTSSKVVKEYRLVYGEPDVIQVRKVFENGKDARIWESKVLRRLDAASSDKWLNQQNGDGRFNTCGRESCNKGVPMKESSRQKVSAALKGRIWYNNGKIEVRSYFICPDGFKHGRLETSIPNNTGANNGMYGKSAWNSGKTKHTEPKLIEIGNKISEAKKGKMAGELNPMFGKTHSKDARLAIRESRCGKHWYTDGTVTVYRNKCPEGFYPGRS